MKRFIWTLIVLAILGGTGYYLFDQYKEKKSPYKNALKAEAAGNFQNAYNFYTDALVEISPSMTLPDFNKSKVVSGAIWQKDLKKYSNWICMPAQLPQHFIEVSNVLNKYKGTYSLAENRIVNISFKKLDNASFVSEWKNAFFAPTAQFDSLHQLIANDAFTKNISVLKLTADKGFSYELNLIDLSNGKGTKFFLYSEGTVYVLAKPGDHILSCKSTVTFSSGEIWRSSNTIIPLSIPENSSLMTGIFITKVAREKE